MIESLIVFGVAILVYPNSLQGEFLFDDGPVLKATLKLRNESWRTWIRWMFMARHSFPRPLLFLTYKLNHRLSGENLFGWHLTNVGIHALNSVLAYLILIRFFEGFGPLLGALIFATHPLATSAVSSISGRSASLCAVFYFSGLLTIVNGWWLLVPLLFWWGVKSKGEMVVMPIAGLAMWFVMKTIP